MVKKLPENFVIQLPGWDPIPVQIVDGLMDRIGEFNRASNTISIARDLPPEQQWMTLFHEILHVLSDSLAYGVNTYGGNPESRTGRNFDELTEEWVTAATAVGCFLMAECGFFSSGLTSHDIWEAVNDVFIQQGADPFPPETEPKQ